MSKKPPLQNQRFKWWEHVTSDKNNKGIASLDFKIVSECGSIPMFGINMMKNLCETMAEIDKWVRIKSDMDRAKYNKEVYGI